MEDEHWNEKGSEIEINKIIKDDIIQNKSCLASVQNEFTKT